MNSCFTWLLLLFLTSLLHRISILLIIIKGKISTLTKQTSFVIWLLPLLHRAKQPITSLQFQLTNIILTCKHILFTLNACLFVLICVKLIFTLIMRGGCLQGIYCAANWGYKLTEMVIPSRWEYSRLVVTVFYRFFVWLSLQSLLVYYKRVCGHFTSRSWSFVWIMRSRSSWCHWSVTNACNIYALLFLWNHDWRSECIIVSYRRCVLLIDVFHHVKHMIALVVCIDAHDGSRLSLF